jgi:chromosome transmission fidelity protein 1
MWINPFMVGWQSLNLDIEELMSVARQEEACGYYASRKSMPTAQLVTLPYNLLLHKDMREASGINLRENIVIIDEAHNLVETMNEIYSVLLSMRTLLQAHHQVSRYYETYQNRLHANNTSYIQQILELLSAFIQYLKSQSSRQFANLTQESSAPESEKNERVERILSLNDFSFDCKIDHINLFKLDKFLDKSEIVKKLHGFNDCLPDEEPGPSSDDQPQEHDSKRISALAVFRDFLRTLTNADADGRILLSLSS